MKTAKEMFEELGYKPFGINTELMSYQNKDKGYYIGFDIKRKKVMAHKPSSLWIFIELEELQAINKQVEELGWLDE